MFGYETESSGNSNRRIKYFWILAAAALAVGVLFVLARG
jgi:hypothetical protein